MPAIESKLNPLHADFQRDAEHLLDQLKAVQSLEDALITSAEKKRDKYAARGMLLPRERLALLIDNGSPFIEISSLAGYKMYDDKLEDSPLLEETDQFEGFIGLGYSF